MGLLDQNNYAGYAQEGQRLAVEPMSFTPMDAARFVAEATPIIGDAMAAKEIYDELQKDNPNYKYAAGLGALALVGIIPGVGDALKKGGRGLLDVVNRIEVDPNALGMSGGNVSFKTNADKGIQVFHGGPDLITKPKMLSDPEGTPIGFSVTPDKGVANNYKKMRGGGHISEFEINKDKYNPISEMEYYNFIDNFESKLGLNEGEATELQIADALKLAKINAVEYPDPEFGIRILNSDIIKPILKNLTAAGLLAPGALAAMQEYKKQQELERGLLSR
jgi:hypothetical protein